MDANLESLQHQFESYRSSKNDMCEVIDDLGDLDKLGQGFTPVDPLEEVDIGDGTIPRLTFINKKLEANYKVRLIELLKEYVNCFAWSYAEMPGLNRELVEHWLPIKDGFKPYKQLSGLLNLEMYDCIKEEINQLFEANFIKPYRYANWISNIVPAEKK